MIIRMKIWNAVEEMNLRVPPTILFLFIFMYTECVGAFVVPWRCSVEDEHELNIEPAYDRIEIELFG